MDPTLAEVRIFAGNFAPRSWAFCQGQLMSIAENTALFSLLGTTYGGDGQVTFGLPDFRGRCATGTGQGPGLSNYSLGQVSGTETVTLLTTEMPAHTHTSVATFAPQASSVAATSNDPTNNFPAATDSTANFYTSTLNQAMGVSPLTVQLSVAGGNQPFSVMQPFLGLNFIIATEGIFPSRN